MAPEPSAPASAADVALKSMTAHILGLANEAHGLLVRCGRAELAVRLDDEARRWRGTATLVVVAGEVKRGKSSLINALVDRPGLLPVGVTVPTSAPLAVSWAEQPEAVVERFPPGLDEPERLAVALDDLTRHATRGPGSALVRRIDVRLPAPVLEGGLVLVDTPGIGSMTAGHRELTLGLLRYADMLVFVTSAEAPLMRSEAEFLATAAQRVAEVQLVVTKADLVADPEKFKAALARRIEELAAVLPADAARGADRLREIAAHAPLLTSALLADRAAAAAHGDRAARLRVRSGIAELRGALTTREQDVTRVRLANVAQTTAGVAAIALAGLDPAADDVRPITPALDRAALATLVSRAGARAQRALTGALNDVETRYRERVDEAKDPAALVAALPAELEAALQGAWLETLSALDADLRAGAAALAGDDPASPLPERVVQASAGRRIEAARARVDAIDHGIPGLSATFLVGSVLFTVMGPVGWVLGAISGTGTVAARALRQARAKTRQQANAAVRDALREARHELAGELRAILDDRRTMLEGGLELGRPVRETAEDADVAAGLQRVATDAEAMRRKLV